MLMMLLSMVEGEELQMRVLELYTKYNDLVFRTGRVYIHNQETLEDVAQEVWIRIIKNLDKIPENSGKKIEAWFVTVVRNAAISQIRKEKRWQRELPIKEDFEPEDPGPGVESVLSTRRVRDVIRSMSDTYRQVLEMRFVEERSSREIAKALGITIEAVDTRVSRGRAILIKKLKEEGITP